MPSTPQRPSTTATASFPSQLSTPPRTTRRPRSSRTYTSTPKSIITAPNSLLSNTPTRQEQRRSTPTTSFSTAGTQPHIKRNRTPSYSNSRKRSRRKVAPSSPSPSPSCSVTSSARSHFLSPRSPLFTPTAFTPSPLFGRTRPASSRALVSPVPSSSYHLRSITDTMSFLTTLQYNFLSAKLEVSFENGANVDMMGGPNTGTSYSLPGQVYITLPSLPTALEGRVREIRDLRIIMEGKSEFFDDEGRYTPMRLHTSTLTLASNDSPLLIPAHDPSRPKSSHVHLAIPFDLRLPGWLPSSHTSSMSNTSYGIRVESTIQWLHSPGLVDSLSRRTLFANSSLQSGASTDSFSVFTPFTIRRHRFPVAVNGLASERPERHYTLRPDSTSASPVECIVTVPEWVDVHGEERSLKVSLRLRARRSAISPLAVEIEDEESRDEEMPQAASGVIESTTTSDNGLVSSAEEPVSSIPMTRQTVYGGPKGKTIQPEEVLTRMVELGMEVEEVERLSSIPNPSFTSSFPIPAEQPSVASNAHPLISPRNDYVDSLLGRPSDSRPYKALRTRQCLLADDGNQRNFFFVDAGLGLGDKWRKVNVVLPMPELGKVGEFAHGGRPQAEIDGPFLRIKHNLKIRVVCRNLGPDAQDTVVILSTPIRFGTCPTTMPGANPSAPTLPAYIQLFHENGELRECDPLPIYSKTAVERADANISSEHLSAAISALPDYKSLYPGVPSGSQSRTSSPAPSGSSSIHQSPSPSPPVHDSMDIDSALNGDDDSHSSTSTWGVARMPGSVSHQTIDKARVPLTTCSAT